MHDGPPTPTLSDVSLSRTVPRSITRFSFRVLYRARTRNARQPVQDRPEPAPGGRAPTPLCGGGGTGPVKAMPCGLPPVGPDRLSLDQDREVATSPAPAPDHT